MDIILASGSPRRHELLTRVQLDFTVMSVDIDETQHDNETPKAYIERMVASKAHAAIQQLMETRCTNQTSLTAPLIILTADTIGVLPDGQTVLVKPVDRKHAYSMWQEMSASTHEVWTAVQAVQVLLPSHNKENAQIIKQQQITERTEVTFIPLTSEMMARYWDTGEPADKAGGYGIQGIGAAWVSHIKGSYTNVVGLPLAQTLALIKQMQMDDSVDE